MFLPDLGLRIQNAYICDDIGNFVLNHFKNKNIVLCEICYKRKNYDNKIYFNLFLLVLFLDHGSGMGKNQDPHGRSRVRKCGEEREKV